jgi:hypothetical protein
VNFSEQPPSTQWAALKYRGETIAEVWFKPEGEPFALWFRIPQSSFQIPGFGQQLTAERLLRAVGLLSEEVEFWRHEGAPDSDTDLGQPLAPPPQDVAHLDIYVSLNSPPSAVVPVQSDEAEAPPAVASAESDEPEIPTPVASEPGDEPETPAAVASEPGDKLETPEAKWQYLEGRWNAILGVEASVESLRTSMESLRAEMEAAARHSLNFDEKLHALSADMVLWDRAKSRIRYALPKMREFVHRATWATAIPERKKVEEDFESHVRPRVPFPQVDEVIAEFDALLKNRQVLSGQGVSVYHESKHILAEVEGALKTLRRNSAANGARKRSASGKRRKSL